MYSLSEGWAGEAHHGGAVWVRAGFGWGPVLAMAGDRVEFSTNAFTVNGISHPLLPHMPVRRDGSVPENHWFVWPEFGISGHGNVGEGAISAMMLQLAMVSENQFVGKPFKRWFWRRQIIVMSRFVNLEFGDESENQSQAGEKALVKDEVYYFAEARTAFETGNFEQGLRFYSKVLEFNPQNAAAWTGQVRMLIELGEYREAKLWADKALERFPNEPELLAAKAVALGRSGDLQGALAFSDASIEERGDTPYVWLARGDVMLARKEHRADYCFEKALLLAPKDWFVAWLAARIRFYYEQFVLALKLLQQAVEWNAGHFLLWLELGQCQQALGLVGLAENSFRQAQQLNPHSSEADLALVQLSAEGVLARAARLVAATFQPMSTENLNRLLSAANEFDASDLHLVAGVPPAFRVNGEIIIADEDALTEDEITRHGQQAAERTAEEKIRAGMGVVHFHPAQCGRARARHVLPAQQSPGNELAFLRRQDCHARGTRPAGKN